MKGSHSRTDIFGKVFCPTCGEQKFFPVYKGLMKVNMCKRCNILYKPVLKSDSRGNSLESAFDMAVEPTRSRKLKSKELA